MNNEIRPTLQNRKGYTKSPEFPPALGLFIPSLQLCKFDSKFKFFFVHTQVYIYIYIYMQ